MDSFLSTDASTFNESISYQNYFFRPRDAMANNIRNDLSPEPLSNYYEERKEIIFNKKDVNSNEDLYLNLLKKSQLIVNEKYYKILNGGFFSKTPKDIYNLSLALKENIANYSLIFSLYFMEGENLKAYKLFVQMCELNKNSINFITSEINIFFPKITNNNRIGLFYPTIIKIMLQILSIFIKLSRKFGKSTLEKEYIILYFKIVHILSIKFRGYRQGNSIETINILKNERKYFYASFLFDSSLYLFNRYQTLSIIIDILNHILELYGNKLTFFSDEIESILLLKVNFNLGLFYYVNGNNNESINNLIQAKKRLLDIKYFPEALDNNDREYSPKYLSNIYLGANSLLTFKNPILLDQIKEKILVEIELLLSEIELNRKNYKDSLNHINAILNMNSLSKSNNNNSNDLDGNNNKLMLSIKSSVPSDSNLLSIKKKNNNINNNKINPLDNDNIKLANYVLTDTDKNRMMFILGKIESAK